MSRKRGFTLIEIVVAMAIFVIILSLAIFSHQRSRTNNELRLASRELLQDLEYAKSIAQKSGSTASLDFTRPPSDASAGYGILDANNLVYKQVRLKPNISVITTFTGKIITFKANKSCTADGTITITNPATPMIFTLTITRMTGLLKLQEK